jgi:hypothetical protein
MHLQLAGLAHGLVLFSRDTPDLIAEAERAIGEVRMVRRLASSAERRIIRKSAPNRNESCIMANGLLCPNPACKHVFAVAEVARAVSLTCPRCGCVFHFDPRLGGTTILNVPRPAATTPTAPQAIPLAQAPPPRVTGVDVELLGPVPLAGSPPLAAPAATAIVPPSVLQRHRQRPFGRWKSVVMGSLLAVVVVAMILGGYFMFPGFFTAPPSHEEKPNPPGPRFSRGPSLITSTGRPPVSRAAEQPSPAPPVQPIEQPETRPQQPGSEYFRGVRCEVEAPEGVWTKYKAEEVDEQGDLYLKLSSEAAQEKEGASVLVVILEKGPGDLAAAVKTVQDRLAEQRKPETFARAADRPDVEQVGELPGRILELKQQNGDQPRKYLMLAVVQTANAIFAIRCECNWERRQQWRPAFRNLLKSFRVT